MTEPINGRTERLQELERALAVHPGKIAAASWHAAQRTAAMHQRNVAELQQLIASAEADEAFLIELVQNVRPSNVPELFTNSLDQRLHNMLASAVTSVDHTRRLVANYPGSNFAGEFAGRNEVVATATVTAFLRRLRNYLLHYALPLYKYRLQWTAQQEPNTPSGQILLDTTELLRWPDWTERARQYLEAAGPDLRIHKSINEYVALMDDLHRWTFGQFEVLHGGDVTEANALIDQYNRVLTGEYPT